MALDDFVEDSDSGEQDGGDNEGMKQNGHLKMAGIERNIRERALSSSKVKVDGNGNVTADPHILARWFALMCMDYTEAELPDSEI